jgi:large subunit ribosomal protein L21
MEFAIIKTGGKQYKVSPGQKIKIEKIDAQESKGVVFNEVLLIDDGKNVAIGMPTVKGAKVEGKVLEQGRADKVIIFKYKSKKRYQVKRGHRQPYSLVEITKIVR